MLVPAALEIITVSSVFVQQLDAAMHLLRGSTASEDIKSEHAKKAPYDRNVSLNSSHVNSASRHVRQLADGMA
jgi:hypothetical protein